MHNTCDSSNAHADRNAGSQHLFVWILRNKFSDLETLFTPHKTELDKSSFCFCFCFYSLLQPFFGTTGPKVSSVVPQSLKRKKQTNKQTKTRPFGTWRFYIGVRQPQLIHTKLHLTLSISIKIWLIDTYQVMLLVTVVLRQNLLNAVFFTVHTTFSHVTTSSKHFPRVTLKYF